MSANERPRGLRRRSLLGGALAAAGLALGWRRPARALPPAAEKSAEAKRKKPIWIGHF